MFELNGDYIVANASADLSASQFRFADFDGNGRIVIASAIGQVVLGVLDDKPNAIDRPGSIKARGWAKVRYNAVLAKGADVISDATGNAIAPVSTADYVIGRAMMAGAAGDIGLVAITHRGQTSAGRILTFTYDLVDITATTVLNLTGGLPFAGRITSLRAIVTRAGTGAGATITLTPSIGGVNLTGGVLTPTLANTAAIGSVINSTAVTALNAFAANQAIALIASAITVFTAGRIEIVMMID